jgi:hypothetical protein
MALLAPSTNSPTTAPDAIPDDCYAKQADTHVKVASMEPVHVAEKCSSYCPYALAAPRAKRGSLERGEL